MSFAQVTLFAYHLTLAYFCSMFAMLTPEADRVACQAKLKLEADEGASYGTLMPEADGVVSEASSHQRPTG